MGLKLVRCFALEKRFLFISWRGVGGPSYHERSNIFMVVSMMMMVMMMGRGHLHIDFIPTFSHGISISISIFFFLLLLTFSSLGCGLLFFFKHGGSSDTRPGSRHTRSEGFQLSRLHVSNACFWKTKKLKKRSFRSEGWESGPLYPLPTLLHMILHVAPSPNPPNPPPEKERKRESLSY